MTTNDERREMAAKLRGLAGVALRGSDDVVGFIEALDEELFDFGPNLMSDIALRLAEFIDPDERTCHMVFDHLTDTAFCDVCGERFDGVAQYMAMVPNGFSVADYKAKYKDAKFCPHCGAKVVE